MRILITGATGFIGSKLAERLSISNIVYALTRNDEFNENRISGIEYVRGDLLDYEWLKIVIENCMPDVVVHLAAYTPVRFSFNNPILYANINYVGTINLVEATLSYGRVEQFVVASSAEVYGPYQFPHTVNEESVAVPTTPYGISKLAAELYVRYANQRGLNFTVLRPTNTYGRSFNLPEEARGYFIEKAIIGALTKKKLEFDGYPESTRKFMYVEDHVRAYLRVIGNKKAYNQVFNVAPDEQAVSLGEVVELIKKLTGREDLEVEWGLNPRPLDPNHLDVDGSKFRRRLGWIAKYSLVEGLKKTISYWKAKLKEEGIL